MTDQNSKSVIIQETISQITPIENPTPVSEITSVQDIPSNEAHVDDTVIVKLTPAEIGKACDSTENNKPKIDVLQEILKSNANFHSKVNLEEEEDEEEEVQRSLPQKSKVSKKYSHESSSESSDSTDYDNKDFVPHKLKLKHAVEIIPDIGFSSGNTSKTFDDVREMIAYYNKHKETFHNYYTQKINRMLLCEGYKFSKIGGNFNIVAADTSASKPRDTWKNKSIELEKIMQTIQHNNERLRNDVEILTSKLVKAYSKISSQSRDIENLTKVVTNMYETQIPALTNKINKLKLANKYAR